MISAIDLRKRGLKVIEEALQDSKEGIIAYKGEPKYVVLPFKEYDRLRALELDLAYLDVLNDIKQDNFKSLSSKSQIDEHIEELQKSL